MVNPERTNQREGSLAYSSWHRKLPDECLLTDIDAVEIRHQRGIVAVMEIIRCRKIDGVNATGQLHEAYWKATVEKSSFKQKQTVKIANALGCSAYLVAHDDDLTNFWVLDLLNPDKGRKEYDEPSYRYFIRGL